MRHTDPTARPAGEGSVAFAPDGVPPARRPAARARGRFRAGLARWGEATQRMAYAAFAIRIAGAAIMFVSQTLLARWMGGHEFGNYVYVWSWLNLVADLAHLGMPLTAPRYVPQYTQTGSFALLRGYLVASRWITFATATVAAVIGAAAVHALGAAIESDLLLPFYFACLALPFYTLTFMLDGLARSYDWIRLALLPAYVLRPLLLIAAVAGARTAGVRLDATLVCGLMAAAAWLVALAQLLQMDRKLRATVPPGPRSFDMPRWLDTALPIFLVWGMYTLLTSTDILVLRQFRPADEVAHYYAAAKSLALGSIIYFAVGAASAHRFASYHVAGNRAGLEDFAARMVSFTFWPTLALTLLVLGFGRPVLALFGPDFVAAYPAMAILAVGQLARASVGPAERLLNTVGQQRICAAAYTVAFAVNLGACFALTPHFGGSGAAAATAVASVTESVLLALIAKRKLGLHLFVWRSERARMRAAGPSAATGYRG